VEKFKGLSTFRLFTVRGIDDFIQQNKKKGQSERGKKVTDNSFFSFFCGSFCEKDPQKFAFLIGQDIPSRSVAIYWVKGTFNQQD
jgi:hypothetical protein